VYQSGIALVDVEDVGTVDGVGLSKRLGAGEVIMYVLQTGRLPVPKH